VTDRRTFIGVIAGGLLTAPLAVEAQPVGKVYRIGLLGLAPLPESNPDAPGWGTLRQGMKELGYVEGKNIVFEYRWSEGKVDRFQSLAAELARLHVDVIVTIGPGVAPARRATTTIPIVMSNSGDPVGEGLIASLAHPGGNITGVGNTASREVHGKSLDLLKQTVPKASTIAFLFDPAGVVWRKELESAADTLGVTLRFTEFRPDALEDVFVGLAKARVAALLVNGNSLEYVHRHRIIELAARHRLPAMYMWPQAVADGGLMSYGPDFGYLAYRAATYVDKILKGAKPADLPVERPTKFELVINLKTAKALGLTIPPSLLQRADQVIE